jgi:competence protein ComEC
MSNKAKEVLIPKIGVLRATFLYVGQGESTLLTIPNGNAFIYVLIDTNNDKKNGGIDLTKLMKDLLGKDGQLIFINTHPHNDHLKGIKSLNDEITINEIWHSGHKPGKDHNDAYQEMLDVIKKIGTDNEYVLFGTNDSNKVRKSDKESEVIKRLGDIDYIVLSPAEYVHDDVDEEDAEGRYKRIHERCAVIKFSYGGKSTKHILMTGDSDKTAWKEHITDYHYDKLSTDVLSASHHGSRTFFKNDESDEEIYEKHIDKIAPAHLIMSAPKKTESPHDHPHDDAIELYRKHVAEDNIYHLGKNRECVIVDISCTGDIGIKFDQELVKEYGFCSGDDGDKNKSSATFPGTRTSRIDNQPMG